MPYCQSPEYFKQWKENRRIQGLCVRCGAINDNPRSKNHCKTCAAKIKAHRDDKKKKGICTKGSCKESAVSGLAHCEKHRRLVNARNNAAKTKLKRETFEAYGGAFCYCCLENALPLLTIDHIDNNGGEHRREIGMKTGADFYKYLKKLGYPPGYRVACWSCNSGRAANGGMCPHEQERNALLKKLASIPLTY